jgi:hypothetical protein
LKIIHIVYEAIWKATQKQNAIMQNTTRHYRNEIVLRKKLYSKLQDTRIFPRFLFKLSKNSTVDDWMFTGSSRHILDAEDAFNEIYPLLQCVLDGYNVNIIFCGTSEQYVLVYRTIIDFRSEKMATWGSSMDKMGFCNRIFQHLFKIKEDNTRTLNVDVKISFFDDPEHSPVLNDVCCTSYDSAMKCILQKRSYWRVWQPC